MRSVPSSHPQSISTPFLFPFLLPVGLISDLHHQLLRTHHHVGFRPPTIVILRPRSLSPIRLHKFRLISTHSPIAAPVHSRHSPQRSTPISFPFLFFDPPLPPILFHSPYHPLLMRHPVPLGVKKVLFGKKIDCNVRLVSAGSTEGGLGVQLFLESNKEMVDFVISSPGLHLALNACAAATVARFLGVSLSQIGISLSNYTPVHMRSELEVSHSGIRSINDVYNANPASTKAVFELLKGIDCKGKRVAVLGDMLELGPIEITFHEMGLVKLLMRVISSSGSVLQMKVSASN